MARPKRTDTKREALKAQGTLHARPEKVTDELFRAAEFFDPRDLIQVKYEMLRRVRIDGLPILGVARAFGLSRPSFYLAQSAFEREGLAGLLPAKRGPRGAHKLSESVMAFIDEQRSADPSLNASELARRVQARFGVSVHRRSIERALKRAVKKTP